MYKHTVYFKKLLSNWQKKCFISPKLCFGFAKKMLFIFALVFENSFKPCIRCTETWSRFGTYDMCVQCKYENVPQNLCSLKYKAGKKHYFSASHVLLDFSIFYETRLQILINFDRFYFCWTFENFSVFEEVQQ